MSKPVRVLGIESSCDETAVSLLVVDGSEVTVEQSLVTSQIPIHQRYGGVVPEVAARSHVPEAVSLVRQTVERFGRDGFDVVAVTNGPGLPTALSVGVETARSLACLSGKDLIGVNHLEGHIASAWLNAEHRASWAFPILVLVVSGGHTELVLMKGYGEYMIIGETRDDAAGEAFDKSAKLMKLPYPGGPEIAKLALEGDPKAFSLPRPMLDSGDFDFSFSGLKTAVRQEWERLVEQGIGLGSPASRDFAASIQAAIVDVLCIKTVKAAIEYDVRAVALVGGVSANVALRQSLGELLKVEASDIQYFPSDRTYITDNAAMIAAAGFWQWQLGRRDDWRILDIAPELHFPRMNDV